MSETMPPPGPADGGHGASAGRAGRSARADSTSSLATYTRAARAGAASVIQTYGRSVGTATWLLTRRLRSHVTAVYALVRLADEIVDGVASEAGVAPGEQRDMLDALEADTERALRIGYSTNVVVHAFAMTARWAGIGSELTRPFFASMRRDLDPSPLDSGELAVYIHGSTEVIGLMCLKVFLTDRPTPDAVRKRLEEGARRLGAAGQKLDFLRDLAVDWTLLGRNYFPGINPRCMTEGQKANLILAIERDLAVAAETIPELPGSCRRAVMAVYGLLLEITARIRSMPAAELPMRRVRVPTHVKLMIAARAALRGGQY